MNVFILITKGDLGGAQMSVRALARALVNSGVNVTVGVSEDTYLYDALTAEHIPCVSFQTLTRSFNPFRNIAFIIEFRKYLNSNAFDVVHINSSNALFGAIAARYAKRRPRVVFTFRGLSLIDPNYTSNPILKYFFQQIFRLLLKYVDTPVFVSEQNYSYALANKIVSSGVVIYNGIDPTTLNFLSQKDAREAFASIPTDVTIIGTISRLAYPKNHVWLIEQFARMYSDNPSVRCVIIGEGPDHHTITQTIEKHNLKDTVILLGAIPDAAQYIRMFDVFVLPSIFEGMPITLIEALHAGVPVLATRVGGIPEMIDADAQLFTLGDAAEFKNKLSRLVSEPQLRNQLALHNSAISDQFTIAKTARNYMNIYAARE